MNSSSGVGSRLQRSFSRKRVLPSTSDGAAAPDAGAVSDASSSSSTVSAAGASSGSRLRSALLGVGSGGGGSFSAGGDGDGGERRGSGSVGGDDVAGASATPVDRRGSLWKRVRRRLSNIVTRRDVETESREHVQKNPLALDVHERLVWSDMETVARAIEEAPHLVVVGFGVTWNLPSVCTLAHLHHVGKVGAHVEMTTLLINQEEYPEFCEANGILVGSTVLQMYKKNAETGVQQLVVFRRPKWEPSELFAGHLNTEQLLELVRCVQDVDATPVVGEETTGGEAGSLGRSFSMEDLEAVERVYVDVPF